MKINLHIERVVLDGLSVAPQQAALVESALRDELAQWLSRGELSSELMAGGALSSVPASPIQLAKDTAPLQLGEQIARCHTVLVLRLVL